MPSSSSHPAFLAVNKVRNSDNLQAPKSGVSFDDLFAAAPMVRTVVCRNVETPRHGKLVVICPIFTTEYCSFSSFGEMSFEM